MSSSGELQGANGAPSSEHSSVASGSAAANVNVASVRTVVRSGPESMRVSGGVTSGGGPLTVHAAVAGVGSALPVRSSARTAKLCTPGATPVSVRGDVQEAKAPPSSAHSKSRSGPGVRSSEPRKRKVAVVLVVGLAGASTRRVSGAVASGPGCSSSGAGSIVQS